MNRRAFTAALAERLAIGMGDVPGDVGRPPSGLPLNTADPAYRYWILYPLTGQHVGPPSRPEADAALVYQVTYVARRADQLEAMADRGRSTLFARDADGTYTAVDAAGITVMDIVVDQIGAIDFEGDIGNLPDTFRFYVTAS